MSRSANASAPTTFSFSASDQRRSRRAAAGAGSTPRMPSPPRPSLPRRSTQSPTAIFRRTNRAASGSSPTAYAIATHTWSRPISRPIAPLRTTSTRCGAIGWPGAAPPPSTSPASAGSRPTARSPNTPPRSGTFQRRRADPAGAANALQARPARSVAPQQADEAALHLDPVRPEDARLVGLVGGFEGDRGAAPAQPLQRHLDIVDQRHDDGAVIGGVATLDDHGIAVEDAGVDHAVARDFERVMLAAANEAPRHRDGITLVAQRFDRGAGGDPAVERQIERGSVGRDRRSGQRGGEIAADHGRREAAALDRAIAVRGRRCGAVFRQFDDLERPRSVRQPADEAAFLQPADQPVDARFRAQLQRVFHLVERRRDAGRREALVDEDQQLVLLFRQHGVTPP